MRVELEYCLFSQLVTAGGKQLAHSSLAPTAEALHAERRGQRVDRCRFQEAGDGLSANGLAAGRPAAEGPRRKCRCLGADRGGKMGVGEESAVASGEGECGEQRR